MRNTRFQHCLKWVLSIGKDIFKFKQYSKIQENFIDKTTIFIIFILIFYKEVCIQINPTRSSKICTDMFMYEYL